MSAIRLTKEYNIALNDNLRLKYGSVNRFNPIVVYFIGKTWITPLFDGDYENDLNKIINNFKRRLKEKICYTTYFNDDFICDFDLKINSMMKDKPNFLSFEFYLRQQNEIVQLKDIEENIEDIFKNPIDMFINDLNEKCFSARKKKRACP